MADGTTLANMERTEMERRCSAFADPWGYQERARAEVERLEREIERLQDELDEAERTLGEALRSHADGSDSDIGRFLYVQMDEHARDQLETVVAVHRQYGAELPSGWEEAWEELQKRQEGLRLTKEWIARRDARTNAVVRGRGEP